MRIVLIAAAAAAILVAGAAAMLAVSDRTLALAGSTTTSASPAIAPARTVEDVSGPCDEAEHANDPRCSGSAAARKPAAKTKATRREDRADHRRRHDDSRPSGAAHDANDDRVTGVDDHHRGDGNSGPGGGGNSWPGSGGDDHGGHGRDHAEDD
jgi:hypothetical protein